jgi:hypothetical protein
MPLLITVLLASVSVAGITYTVPAGWKNVPTASSMRIAQFAIPRAGGDTQATELVVYYFGGSGGTVDANIERWLGQMQQPDGRPSREVARHDARTINGLKVTVVDVSGTYIAEMTPGAKERHNSPNFRMRAAVIETDNGPYFVKLTGPANTVRSAERGFDQFLASIKYHP